MAKKKSRNSAILSEKEIHERLARERETIEHDVDRSIDVFIKSFNRNIVGNLLKGIQSAADPEAAYQDWKNYAKTGNDIALRSGMRDWRVSSHRYHAFSAKTIRVAQGQDGLRTAAPKQAMKRAVAAGFNTASTHRKKGKKNANHRGGMDAQQEAIYEVFLDFARKCDGPSAANHPLKAALAPHLRAAVEKKLLGSYAEFKKQAGKPLVDERVIRSLREEVLADALARFDRLAKESYGRQNSPMPYYGFLPEQMPQSTTFGMEIEGFSALDQTYPGNLVTLAQLFGTSGLNTIASLKPKSDGYAAWSATYDNSIVSPLHFNGRYKDRHTITANSSSFELVSPILHGPAGHTDFLTAVNVLQGLDFRSNRSCGLHMHISVEDTTLQQKKNLVKALYHNEAALDDLISPERRGDGNLFALSHKAMEIDKVDQAKTLEELIEVINPGKNRNYKFDMTGLVLPGAPPTIQYRGAGGAAYLNTSGDYAVILANFTAQALENPEVRLADVISELVQQRNGLKKAQEAPAAHGGLTAQQAAHPKNGAQGR